MLEKLSQPPSLKQMAYQSLKGAILENRLEPGKFYNEQQLAKQLGVSKTPVREALMDLAAQGFVILLPRKGFRIRELTEKDIRDLYQSRRALETAVVRSIADNIKETDLLEIQGIHSKESDAINRFDRAKYMEIDREFHLFLASLTGNAFLITSLENIRDLVDWSGLRAIADRNRMEEINREHGRIIDALAAKNAQKVEYYMDAHLRTSEEYIANHAIDIERR